MKWLHIVLDILFMLFSALCMVFLYYSFGQWVTVADNVDLPAILGPDNNLSLWHFGVMMAQAVIFIVSFFRLLFRISKK